MLDLAHLDRGVGDGAAALAAIGEHLLAVAHPAFELGRGVAGIVPRQVFPDLVAFLGELVEVCRDQLILGTEMAIKRHLVRGCGLRDGIDADSADAMAIEKVPRGGKDALAGWGLRSL